MNRLEIKLGENEDLSFQMSSLFHGAMMECISQEYADILHISGLHPYTQHVERRDRSWYWIITTLNEDAKCEIIDKLASKDAVFILKKQLNLKFIKKRYIELTKKEFASIFYNEKPSRYINIQFITPTAFKINGRYINYPDIRAMYINIMNKYDAVNDEDAVCDDDVLDNLLNNTTINRYELRSTMFSLEGVRIPAFTGRITLKINDTQTMCSFANMLFRFAEYSGIGIKTALGMGAVRLLQNRGSSNE